jgi:hypothetical protein
MKMSILKTMDRGFPGNLSRGIDNIISTLPNSSETAIEFGGPVQMAADGKSCLPWASGKTFYGVAVRGVKTNNTYLTDDAKYNKNDAVDICSRGGIMVICTKDETATTDPVKGATVYLRKATGKFVAAAEGSGGADTVALTGVVWAQSGCDSDGVAEITILNRLM